MFIKQAIVKIMPIKGKYINLKLISGLEILTKSKAGKIAIKKNIKPVNRYLLYRSEMKMIIISMKKNIKADK
jgi:hypothetical protein